MSVFTPALRVPLLQPLRLRAASYALAVGSGFAASLLLLPNGLAPFGALLLLATLLAPDAFRQAWSTRSAVLAPLSLMVAVVLLVAVLSMQSSGQALDSIEKTARLVLLPWCAMLAFSLGLSRGWLWVGAMAGIGLGFGLAVAEALAGSGRVGVGSNPIVFANGTLALMALALFCRPRHSGSRATLAVIVSTCLGLAAIVMSGSRGALPGVVLLVVLALASCGMQQRPLRRALSLALGAALIMGLALLPGLSKQTRLVDVPQDLQGFAQGEVDSPIAARLRLLELAGSGFGARRWMGIGIERFDVLVDRMPECRVGQSHICTLGHAHNDLAQWAATMGNPGLAALLALYLVPLLVFVRLIQAGGRGAGTGAAWAGASLVVVTFLCGLTQSMFSHSLTSTAYAVLVGLLVGIALKEALPAAGSAVMDGPAAGPDLARGRAG